VEKSNLETNSHNVHNDLGRILISYHNIATSCLWKRRTTNCETEKSAYVLNPNSTPQQTKLLNTSIHTPWDGNMTTTHMWNTNRFTLYCSKEYNPSYLHHNYQSAKQWFFNTIYQVLTAADDIWTSPIICIET